MFMNPQSDTPVIFVNIKQPGDRGDFLIQVVEARNNSLLCESRIPENVSYLQYLYTAQLLEKKSAQTAANNHQNEAIQDDSWMQSDRYQDMVRYGQKLYTDLFGEGFKSRKFRNIFKKDNAIKDGVRIILQLDSTASELWNIPWEYIHDGEQFIAIEGKHSIVRRPAGLSQQSADKWANVRNIPQPLRILFVIADPAGAAPLIIDQEINLILTALESARQKDLVTIDYIEEGTLANIEYALAENEYHVLHYTGHGAMVQGGSCLLLEDMDGNPEPAFIRDLLPILKNYPSLRLVFLSGCQTGQIDETQATSGIATGLLEVIPAVLAMQFSILDISAQVFTEAFYGAIGRGATLEKALQIGRAAMHKRNGELADWGVPALYQQSSNIRLIDPNQPAVTDTPKLYLKAEELPVPKILFERRHEIRELRKALRWTAATAFIWGMGGVGKSALAGRLIERPGIHTFIDSALVIRCDKTLLNEVIPKIVQWLESIEPQAADMLKNDQIPLPERISRMITLMNQKRLVLVFDHFDSYMQEHPEQRRWWVPHKGMSAFFQALAASKWTGLIIFTSRYRWAYLNQLAPDNHMELHLDSLGFIGTAMLCRHLPALTKADMEMYKLISDRIGGHPLTLYTIDQLYAKHGRQLVAKQDKLIQQLGQFWQKTFLGDALARLDEREKQTLVGISILDSTFWSGHVQIIANVSEHEQAEAIMARWEALSLAHFIYTDNNGDPWYEIHHMVRAYLLDMLKPSHRQQLHARAAEMMETSLSQSAHSRYELHGGPQPPTNNHLAALFELELIFEHGDPMFVRHMVGRALDWRRHYIACNDHERANNIVFQIWQKIAFKYGNKELAKKLLQETFDTTIGRSHDTAELYLANIMEAEGQEDEAMQIYRRLYKAFEKQDDKANMVSILNSEARYYHRQGKLKKAIDTQQKMLSFNQERGDRRAEADTLTQLALYYSENEDSQTALKMAHLAQNLAREVGDIELYRDAIFACGQIYKSRQQYMEAFEVYKIVLQIAQERGDPVAISDVLCEIGYLFFLARQYDESTRFYLEALHIYEQMQEYRGLTLVLWRLATTYGAAGVKREAIVMAERALKYSETYEPGWTKEIRSFLRRARRL